MAERQQFYDNKNNNTERRRGEHLCREEHKWNCIEQKEQMEVDRQARMREDPLLGKKNVSGVPYNIVSMQYFFGFFGGFLENLFNNNLFLILKINLV